MSRFDIASITRDQPLLPSEQKQPESVGLLAGMSAAANSEWAPAFFARRMAASGFSPDPNWQGIYANEDLAKDLLDGISPEYQSMLNGSVSLDHALELRQQALSLQQSRNDLASMGWSGVGLQIGASILDPVNIAAGILTGGAGWVSKGGRLARILKAGAVNAAATAPIEAYIASEDPTRGTTDVMLAAGSAMALGSVLHAAVGERWYKAAQRLQQDAEFKEVLDVMGPSIDQSARKGDTMTVNGRTVVDGGVQDVDGIQIVGMGGLTPNGERRFSDALSPQVTQSIAEGRISQTDLEADSPVLADALRRDPSGVVRRFSDDVGDDGSPIPGAERLAPPPDDTGGGGGAVGSGADGVGEKPTPPPKIATDLWFHNLSDAKSDTLYGLRRLTGDMAMMLGIDEASPILRTAANATLQDPLLKKLDGGAYAAANDSQAAWVHRTAQGKKAEFLPHLKGIRDQWKLKQTGGGDLDKTFNEAVGVAVSQADEPSALLKFSPEVREAAKLVADAHEWGLELMKRHNVEWALPVEAKDSYLHRTWNQPALNRLVKDVGEERAARFFTDAMLSARPGDVDPDLAVKMGKGMLRTLLDLDKANDIEKARILGGDPDAIRRLLHRDASGLTDDEIDQLVMRLKPKSDGGAPSILKSRTLLDENYFEALTDKAGNHYPVSMADLMERDAEKLTSNYIEQAVRISAERATLDAVGAKFGKKFANFDALASAARDEMTAAGVPKTRIDNQISRLETGWRLVRGLPVGQVFGPEAAQAMRIMRDINYITKSGGFGIVQAVEMGNTIAEAGLKATLNAMPALGRMVRNAITGRVDNEIANFAETIMGAGTDPITRRAYSMIDDGALLTGTESAIGKFREKVTEPLSMLSNKVNFLNTIDSRVRKWTVSAVLNRLASEAKDRTLSAKRLLDLGITQSEADQFFKELSKAVVDQPGAWGGRQVTGIDIRKMSPEMGAKLVFAIDRWGTRLIQRNDVGNMAKMMHNDIAKVLLQFRNFAIVAWPKQFLQKIQMADKEAALASLMTSAMGAGVYAIMQSTYSIGRKDAEKFRKERLSWKNIALNGFSRAGWSSVLPGVADNLNSGLHIFEEPLFKYGRASGLSTTGLLQNPTSATVDAAFKTVRSGSTALQHAVGLKPWHLTRSQARSAAQLLPFQNVIGVKNLIEAYTSRLPER